MQKHQRHHPLTIGEKVFDTGKNLLAHVIKVTPKTVLLSQDSTLDENIREFDTDAGEDPMEWRANKENVYQFVPGLVDHRLGLPVCAEHNQIDYPFFSPYLYENLYHFETIPCK